jgi:hypothetical protein
MCCYARLLSHTRARSYALFPRIYAQRVLGEKITVDVYFSHFEYDQKGNWIKAIMVPLFVNEGDTVIWERTYTYFE